MAILHALKLVETSSHKEPVICSDSLSCLLSIQNGNSSHSLINSILSACKSLPKGKIVEFCWVPSHIGIQGNEKADQAAKNAVSDPDVSGILIPYTDLKTVSNMYVKKVMQANWDSIVNNKLKELKPTLGKTVLNGIEKRGDEVRMHRVRIGHTYLTHNYLLSGENQPVCVTCQVPLTVKHILIECPAHDNNRLKFFTVVSLQELFDKIPGSNILNFLKKIGMYHKI